MAQHSGDSVQASSIGICEGGESGEREEPAQGGGKNPKCKHTRGQPTTAIESRPIDRPRKRVLMGSQTNSIKAEPCVVSTA